MYGLLHISSDAPRSAATREKCLETCSNVLRPDRCRGGDGGGGVGREGKGREEGNLLSGMTLSSEISWEEEEEERR